MRRRNSVTLKTIAERADLSVAAVSAALTSSSRTAAVSDATRERVRGIATELGYRPNAVARSLRLQRTDIIGLYCDRRIGWPSALDPFFGKLIGGCEEGCGECRKDLLLQGLYTPPSLSEMHGRLVDGRLDGLVVFTRPQSPLLSLLEAVRLPAIGLV